MNDDHIVELYFARSEEAIAQTSAVYGAYLMSISKRIVGDSKDAEECVNDTYYEAWNTIPPHRPALLSTFLGKLTRRISINRYKKNHAQKRGGSELPLVLDELGDCVTGEDMDSILDQKDLAALIDRFLSVLSRTERLVFVRRYWYTEPVAAIAAVLGWSESRVTSMLFRTRKKLRAMLEKEGFYESH